jgi:metallo-beta-lactamase superfamily protein
LARCSRSEGSSGRCFMARRKHAEIWSRKFRVSVLMYSMRAAPVAEGRDDVVTAGCDNLGVLGAGREHVVLPRRRRPLPRAHRRAMSAAAGVGEPTTTRSGWQNGLPAPPTPRSGIEIGFQRPICRKLRPAGRFLREGHCMYLKFFDVEHGACALITTSGNRHILVDCGTNNSTGWKPATELLWRGISEIERLIVTNYDEDHASGYRDLIQRIDVRGLQRNGNVTASHIAFLKSEDGIGSGIQHLADSFSYFSGPPLPAVVDDVSIAAFCNSYGTPPFGFDDENNLSLVVFITCGAHRIILPGDMERAGWLELLKVPGFIQQLWSVTVFVTSHHGRANGFCEEVLERCRKFRRSSSPTRGWGTSRRRPSIGTGPTREDSITAGIAVTCSRRAKTAP